MALKQWYQRRVLGVEAVVSTQSTPRPAPHAPRPTPHAPRPAPHAPRPTPRAPRPAPHAPRPTPRASRLLLPGVSGRRGAAQVARLREEVRDLKAQLKKGRAYENMVNKAVPQNVRTSA